MKTSDSIERQEARKEAEGKGRLATDNSDPVTGRRRGRIENLKPWPKGVSGNPGGKPRVDLAAQIARAIFENDGRAIYAAYSKMLRKGSAYCFQVLSDRAFGKLKERHEYEISEYRDVSTEDLVSRIAELERELGMSSSAPDSAPELPPPAETKPN